MGLSASQKVHGEGAFLFPTLSHASSAGAALLSERLRLKYETWKNLHKAGYALYPLAFAHSFLIGSTVQKGPVRILWMLLLILYIFVLCHKALRRWSLRRRPFKVTGVRKESPSVHTVFLRETPGTTSPDNS
jgi:predicted ferric reductase